jgi:NADPH2:quinone reductase
VLVLGAGGGLGLAAVDLARAAGARVVAAASSADKLAAAVAAGAEATIDYATEDLKAAARERTGGGPDVVVDPVGGDYSQAAFRSLRWGGRHLVLGFANGAIPRLPLNLALLNNRTVVGVDWGAWMGRHRDEQRALLAEVLELAAAGVLRPAPPLCRPLADAPAVLRDLLERRVAGKVALVP